MNRQIVLMFNVHIHWQRARWWLCLYLTGKLPHNIILPPLCHLWRSIPYLAHQWVSHSYKQWVLQHDLYSRKLTLFEISDFWVFNLLDKFDQNKNKTSPMHELIQVINKCTWDRVTWRLKCDNSCTLRLPIAFNNLGETVAIIILLFNWLSTQVYVLTSCNIFASLLKSMTWNYATVIIIHTFKETITQFWIWIISHCSLIFDSCN